MTGGFFSGASVEPPPEPDDDEAPAPGVTIMPFTRDFAGQTIGDLLNDGWKFYSWNAAGTERTLRDLSNGVTDIANIVGGKLVLTSASPKFWPEAERIISDLTAGVAHSLSVEVSDTGPGYVRVRENATNLYVQTDVATPVTVGGEFTPVGTSVNMRLAAWDVTTVAYDNVSISVGG